MQRAIALHDGRPVEPAPHQRPARTRSAGRSAADRPLRMRHGDSARRPVLRGPRLDRVRRPVERLGRAPGSRRCGGQQRRSSSAARSRRTTISACPWTVRGSPSQRTGCCTVRTADDLVPGHRRVTRKPTRRSPRALTHTPTRSSRSARRRSRASASRRAHAGRRTARRRAR